MLPWGWRPRIRESGVFELLVARLPCVVWNGCGSWQQGEKLIHRVREHLGSRLRVAETAPQRAVGRRSNLFRYADIASTRIKYPPGRVCSCILSHMLSNAVCARSCGIQRRAASRTASAISARPRTVPPLGWLSAPGSRGFSSGHGRMKFKKPVHGWP